MSNGSVDNIKTDKTKKLTPMPKTKSFFHKFSDYSEWFSLHSIFAVIIMAFFVSLYPKFDKDVIKLIWELLPLIFIIGALILNINPKYLKENQIIIFRRIGFMVITSGIVLLMSGGLAQVRTETLIQAKIYGYSSVILSSFSLLLLSYSLSTLLVESIKNIFSKNN